MQGLVLSRGSNRGALMRRRGLLGGLGGLLLLLHGAVVWSAPPAPPLPAGQPGPVAAPLGVVGAQTPMISPREVRPGMTGYGLTVFKGLTPERFPIRVIGVLRHYLPKMDVILIETDDPRLVHTGIVQGMSGSPIYIEGKLAGALAYGWRFSKDAVAGVTPIENMLAELHRPVRGKSAQPMAVEAANVPSQSGRYVAELPRKELLTELARGGQVEGSRTPTEILRLTPGAVLAGAEPKLMRASLPLVVAGLTERALEGLREALQPFNLVPLQAGGIGAATGSGRGPDRFEPGGSIAVQLIRGDISASGTGTVTHVDGNKVLGFGHPMFTAGELFAPVATAEVLTFLASISSSFKLANVLREIGSLILDREACIVAEMGQKAAMIPVQLTVRVKGQPDYLLNSEVASHRAFTPMLLASVVGSALGAAVPDVVETTVRIDSKVTARGFAPLLSTDTMAAAEGVSPKMLLNSMGLRQVMSLIANPFQTVPIDRLEMTLSVEHKAQVAEILSVALASDELEPDTEPSIYVTLQPYGGGPRTVRAVPFTVPRVLAGQSLKIEVAAGNLVRPEMAPAETLPDYVANLRKGYPAQQLVVTLSTTDEGVTLRGRIVPSLPASVVATLRGGSSSRRGELQKRLYRFTTDLGIVLAGKQELTVTVKDPR